MTDAPRLAVTVLAVAVAVAGLVAGYVKRELAEPEPFADRAVAALRSEAVRGVIAEQIAVQLLERRSPDLVATRPLVRAAVEAFLDTDEFARVMRAAAISAHELLVDGDEDVVVELAEARAALLPAIETASPGLAREIPADVSPQIAEVRGSDAATAVVRLADSASVAALPLLLASLALLGVVVAGAPDRRRAAGTAGLALAGGAGLGILALVALRAQVLSHAGGVGILSAADARAAGGAAWDALVGDLNGWLVVAGSGGLAVWAGALLAGTRVDRAAVARRVADVIAGGSLGRPARIGRGLALAAVGALVLLEADPLFEIVVLAAGGAFVLLGVAEALSTVNRSRGTSARRSATAPRGRRAVAGAAVLLAAGAVALVLALRDDAAAPLPREEITACNGMAELCDRRLDEVVFPGTHNSMSAADRPGWFFANQTRPVPRQLDDGVRLLMLDPHYGVRDAQGRVRTDLRAEGTSRNRVARELGDAAVRAAERLAGRLGLLPADGERDVHLCHTLCELGAERMSSTLDEIRGWLERNRAEVLIVFIESSVDPADVEREFADAGLEPFLAALDRDAPLPTLRELIASGRRVIVLDERDGGDAAWFRPGFLLLRDTSIQALLEDRGSCAPRRGAPENPLLLMNHWIDRFPPPREGIGETNGRRALERRIRTCRAERGQAPNLIAVDFYERGDLFAVARDLNRRGVAAEGAP